MDLGPHFRAKLVHLGAKLAIKAPLEALFGALGRLLAICWRLLGVTRAPIGPSWAHLGRSSAIDFEFHGFFMRIEFLGVVGSVLARPGAVLGRLGTPFWPKLAPRDAFLAQVGTSRPKLEKKIDFLKIDKLIF